MGMGHSGKKMELYLVPQNAHNYQRQKLNVERDRVCVLVWVFKLRRKAYLFEICCMAWTEDRLR